MGRKEKVIARNQLIEKKDETKKKVKKPDFVNNENNNSKRTLDDILKNRQSIYISGHDHDSCTIHSSAGYIILSVLCIFLTLMLAGLTYYYFFILKNKINGVGEETASKKLPTSADNKTMMLPGFEKAQQLSELKESIDNGSADWPMISRYNHLLNTEIKHDIIRLAENNIKSNKVANLFNLIQVLMPLVTDDLPEIRSASQKLLSDSASRVNLLLEENPQAALGLIEEEVMNDHADFDRFHFIASLVDAKTGRPNHSTQVAELFYCDCP